MSNVPPDKLPNQPPSNVPPADNAQGVSGPPAPKPKRRKKLRLILTLGGIFLAMILLLIVFAPTIASTGLVKDMVVDHVNGSMLNGKLEIKDWSLGWTSGIELQGIQLSDDKNRVMLQVSRVTTGLTLLHAVSGNLALGNVRISGLNINAVRDRDGKLNLQTVMKPSNSNSTGPVKLPRMSGVIEITDSVGNTYQDDVAGISTVFDLKLSAAIQDINEPIIDSGEIAAHFINRQPGTVKFAGQFAAIHNNTLDVNSLIGDQSISLSHFDLEPVGSLLRANKLDLQVTGMLDGLITARIKTITDISSSGGLTIADASLGGKQLNGDSIKDKKIDINWSASRQPMADAFQQVRLDLLVIGTPVAGALTTQPDKITAKIDAPQEALLQTQEVFSAIAQRLAGHGSTTSTVAIANNAGGSANVTVDIGAANVVGQLRNMIALQKGAEISSGRLTLATDLKLAGGQATVDTQVHLKDLGGKQDGKDIRLTDFDANVNAIAQGGPNADLKQFEAVVSSSFLKVNGTAQGVSRTDFTTSLDLKNFQDQIAQFIDLNGLLHAPAGTPVTMAGAVDIHAVTSGDLAAGAIPAAKQNTIGLQIDTSVKNLTITGLPNVKPIPPQNLTANLKGDIEQAGTDLHAIRNLAVDINSAPIALHATGELVRATTGGWDATFDVPPSTIDLHKAQDQWAGLLGLFIAPASADAQPTAIQKFANGSMRISQGVVTIAAKGKLAQGVLTLSAPATVHVDPIDLSVTSELGVAQEQRLAVMDIVATLAPASTGSGSAGNWLNLKTTIGSTGEVFSADLLTDVLSKPAAGPSIDIPHISGDLKNLQAALGPLLPASMAAVKSGVLSGSMKLQRGEKETLTADMKVDQLSIAGLPDNQSVHFVTETSLKADYSAFTVAKLDGDLGFATLSLVNQQPIQISNPTDSKTMTASGGVTLTGDVAKTMRFVEAVTGAAPNSYGYSGKYAFNESLQKDPQRARMSITGGGSITSFAVLGADGTTPTFTESEIAIDNGCFYNATNKTLIFDVAHPLSIAMKSSGALTLNIDGTVSDLPGQRNLGNVKLMLDYDLAKLWTMIKPMLTPQQQKTYADLKITGKQKRTIVLNGKYPAGKTFNEAVASLNAYGAFQIDTFDYSGISIQNLEVPFYLDQGILQTKYGPRGQDLPKPATCNGGTIDLGNWHIALNTQVMRMVLVGADPQHPHQLLKGVSLNPALSSSLLGSVLNNPAFSGADNAKGLVDLSILQCTGFPLSALAMEQSPSNKGILKMQYSVHGLQMGSTLLQVITQRDSVTGDITNAQASMEAGKVTQDTTLMLDGNKPIRIYGVVILKTKQFAPMTIDISTALLGNSLVPNRNLMQYFPDQISLPLQGDMSHPQLKLDQVVGKLVTDAAQKALLNGVLGGGQNATGTNPPANQSGATSQPANQGSPLDQLLRGLTKPKQ
jgi:hypothetical protein